MDFEGPVPPQSSDSVEVPETTCPPNLDEVQVMAQFSALEGMAIYDVVNLFINAVEFVNGLLQLNVQAES